MHATQSQTSDVGAEDNDETFVGGGKVSQIGGATPGRLLLITSVVCRASSVTRVSNGALGWEISEEKQCEHQRPTGKAGWYSAHAQ